MKKINKKSNKIIKKRNKSSKQIRKQKMHLSMTMEILVMNPKSRSRKRIRRTIMKKINQKSNKIIKKRNKSSKINTNLEEKENMIPMKKNCLQMQIVLKALRNCLLQKKKLSLAKYVTNLMIILKN